MEPSSTTSAKLTTRITTKTATTKRKQCHHCAVSSYHLAPNVSPTSPESATWWQGCFREHCSHQRFFSKSETYNGPKLTIVCKKRSKNSFSLSVSFHLPPLTDVLNLYFARTVYGICLSNVFREVPPCAITFKHIPRQRALPSTIFRTLNGFKKKIGEILPLSYQCMQPGGTSVPTKSCKTRFNQFLDPHFFFWKVLQQNQINTYIEKDV